jgi:hypothetical protein
LLLLENRIPEGGAEDNTLVGSMSSPAKHQVRFAGTMTQGEKSRAAIIFMFHLIGDDSPLPDKVSLPQYNQSRSGLQFSFSSLLPFRALTRGQKRSNPPEVIRTFRNYWLTFLLK